MRLSTFLLLKVPIIKPQEISAGVLLRCQVVACVYHGSYNVEKYLNFSRRLERSLNSNKVLEKYLISL